MVQMAAILRGYEVTGIEEHDIHQFRHFLLVLIHHVTVAS